LSTDSQQLLGWSEESIAITSSRLLSFNRVMIYDMMIYCCGGGWRWRGGGGGGDILLDVYNRFC